METMLDFILTFAVLGGMALIVAQMSKDREVGFWTLFVVSVFFTPFIGVIVALLSRKKGQGRPGANERYSEIKQAQSKFWERFTPKKGGNNEQENTDYSAGRNRGAGMQPKDGGKSGGISL